jgi:hypothetical protein
VSKRYWIAVAGLWLTLPLAAFAFLGAVADGPPFTVRVWSCIALFWLGWGMHRFQVAADDEFHRRYPKGSRNG